MSFQMCYGKVKMLCPHLSRYVDVYIHYVMNGKEIFLIESNGCDEGYNDSKECAECLTRSVEIFKENSLFNTDTR